MWESILRRARVAELSIGVAPLADMTVVVEAPVPAFIVLAFLMFVGMLEMVVNLYTPEMAIVVLAAAGSCLPIPVNRPQQVMVVMTIK